MSISMPMPLSRLQQVDICVTCLSVSRDHEFHPCSEDITKVLKRLLHGFDLDSCLKLSPPDKKLQLCQSCHKTLKDTVGFKETALKSLKQLKNMWLRNLSKTVTPSTSHKQHKNSTMVTPKPEPKKPNKLIITPKTEPTQDPLDVKLEIHNTTHESVDIPIDVKEEGIENNDDSNTANGQSGTDNVDIHSNVVPKTELLVPQKVMVEILPKGTDSSANVNTSNVNSTKIFKARKKVCKNKITISNTQQNVPQRFGKAICILTPLMRKTPGAASKVKFVKLSTANGTSNLVPISQPILVQCPDGTAKVLNPSKPATTTFPHASTITTVHKSTSKNKPLHTAKRVKVICGTKSNKVLQTKSAQSKEVQLMSDFESSNEAKVTKKKPSQIAWYVTVLTREQISMYREEKLKDPMFVKAPFKCTLCGAYYDVKSGLSCHEMYCSSQSKENAEFPCFLCNSSFDSLLAYTTHFRFHTYGCYLYQCPTCQYNVNSIEAIAAHFCPNKGCKVVPPIDPTMILTRSRRQFYCPKCEYVSAQATCRIQAHFNRAHKTDSAVVCEVCAKVYSNQNSYRMHVRTEHEGRIPVAYCAPCRRVFRNIWRYRAHMKTAKHASEDQFIFECDQCDKKFHLKKTLDQHKRVHEMMAGEKSHVCNICGNAYHQPKSLRSHMRSKHSERPPVRDQACDVCGAAFTTIRILRQHMAKHSDARPYKCKFCTDTFKYTGPLYTHMKLKHKYVKGRQYGQEKKKNSTSGRKQTGQKIGKCANETIENREENLENREQSMET